MILALVITLVIQLDLICRMDSMDMKKKHTMYGTIIRKCVKCVTSIDHVAGYDYLVKLNNDIETLQSRRANMLPDEIWIKGDDVRRITKINDNNNKRRKNKMSELKEKFVLALTKEPQKSFRKAGITDGDNLLTTEGQQVFLTWLLNNKFSDEFKKDVVDDILKKKDSDEEENE